MNEPIVGERVVLRRAHADDLEPLLAILREPSVARWWQENSHAELRQLLTVSSEDTMVFVVEIEGDLAGLMYATEENDPNYRHAGIDISLRTSAQDKGVGTDAVRTLAKWLVNERGHHRLTIDPAADNTRAIACYRKVGFKPVGVMRQYERDNDGTWHDGLLMDVLAHELR